MSSMGTNSTTTPITDSSSPALTQTGSTLPSVPAPTTSSQTSKDNTGQPSSSRTTSSTTLNTIIYSSTRTSIVTTVVSIEGSSSTDPLLLSGAATGNTLTRQTISTVTQEVPNSANSSGTISSTNSSQSHATLPVFLVIGLVVVSIIAVSIVLFRRRRRPPQKEAEPVIERPDSCPSFVDTDPFVCVSQSPVPMMRALEDEDHRRLSYSVSTTPGWWDSVGNGTHVFRPHPSRRVSPDGESVASTYSQRSANLPAAYPSTLIEEDGMIGSEGQWSADRNLDEISTVPVSIAYPLPPTRPPRSPRRMSKHQSFDSVSTTRSIPASPLSRLLPENRSE